MTAPTKAERVEDVTNALHLVIQAAVQNATSMDEKVELRVQHLMTIRRLLSRLEEVESALRPFAKFACDPPCEGPCHNCRARQALNGGDDG